MPVPPGETKTFTVTTTEDDIPEINVETLTVSLASPTAPKREVEGLPSMATVTITADDNDSSLSMELVSVAEEDGMATVVVTLDTVIGDVGGIGGFTVDASTVDDITCTRRPST